MDRLTLFFIRGDADLPRKIAPQQPLELPAVPKLSRSAVIAVAIFLAAHLALLIGLVTPEKFVFDEVHYVPAARQMLGSAPSQPMLNPMHPPLAKELIAASIAAFGDNRAGLALSGDAVRRARDRRDLSLRSRAVRIARARDRGRADRGVQPDALCAGAHCDARHLCARLRSARDRRFHARLSTRSGRRRCSHSRVRCSVLRPRANGAACFRSVSASSSLP